MVLFVLAALAGLILVAKDNDTTVPSASVVKQLSQTPDVGVPLAPPLRDTGGSATDQGFDVCSKLAPLDAGKVHDVQHRSVLYLPIGFAADGPEPIVILFHDSETTARRFLAESGFMKLADKHGFAVLSVGSSEPSTLGARPWRKPADRAAALRAINAVIGELCIDRQRLFAVAHGHGGRFLSSDCPLALNGFALVSAYAWRFGAHSGADHTHILKIHPRDHRHEPLFGGRSCGGTKFLPWHEVQELWDEQLSCARSDDPPFRKSDAC